MARAIHLQFNRGGTAPRNIVAMRMMITLITIPMRRVDGNIGNDAELFDKVGSKADGKVLAIFHGQV